MARRSGEARNGSANGAVAAAPHQPCGQEEERAPGRFIGTRGAAALRRYKYSAVDRSIIAPYLQPYWTRVVSFFPLWLAPNCITAGGLALVVLSCALAWRTSPRLDAELDPSLMMVHAALLFAYQTLDAVDGKQARARSRSLSRRALLQRAGPRKPPVRARDARHVCSHVARRGVNEPG